MYQFIEAEPKDVNMKPVEFRNTRISTAYAQKSPDTATYI